MQRAKRVLQAAVAAKDISSVTVAGQSGLTPEDIDTAVRLARELLQKVK